MSLEFLNCLKFLTFFVNGGLMRGAFSKLFSG